MTAEMTYFRPLAMNNAPRPADALALAGGWAWFDRAEVIGRSGSRGLVGISEIPEDWRQRLSAPRPALLGLRLDRPRVIGVVNVTPDSFSDAGAHFDAGAAVAHGRAMSAAGADIIDVGGESTRPGAAEVGVAEELARVLPVIAGLRGGAPISVDTRKAEVARQALGAGAAMVNDVSALSYDAALGPVVAASGAPLCLMHSQGDPATMQAAPQYDNVLLDVYDYLAGRIALAEAAGIPRARIVVDPGIGFGKTTAHNLALLRGLSLFHGLGCALLLGVSRKRFIGEIGAAPEPLARMPGTLALVLAAIAEGVQLHRVHDTAAIVQGIALYRAATLGDRR